MAPTFRACTWAPNEVETPCKHIFSCTHPFAYKLIHSFTNSSTPTFSLLHLHFSLLHLHYFFYNFIFNKIFHFHLHQLPNNMSLLTMGEAHRGTVANIATYVSFFLYFFFMFHLHQPHFILKYRLSQVLHYFYYRMSQGFALESTNLSQWTR
jgi:hypothetical protein